MEASYLDAIKLHDISITNAHSLALNTVVFATNNLDTRVHLEHLNVPSSMVIVSVSGQDMARCFLNAKSLQEGLDLEWLGDIHKDAWLVEQVHGDVVA